MKIENFKTLAKAKFIVPIGLCFVTIMGLMYHYYWNSFSNLEQPAVVYIDADDDIDSLFVKLESIGKKHSLFAFKTLARHTGLDEGIRTGRYEIEPKENAIQVFRKLRNGQQSPINVTVPSVRTMDRLAAELAKVLMVDSASIAATFHDGYLCEKYGCTEATIASIVIPNTYQMYWNISPEKLLERLHKESKIFWNDNREAKAKALGLTHIEVSTLASIIDEETANNAEKPMIAGMYYNRLKIDMPLQADPTVKFAMGDFAAKRIYHEWLTTDSPYNTYANTGLPPGPIRIPSVAGLDAVLNLVHHNYLYMCAKEDFSGTHNFAVTYNEHLQNARKYQNALNARGIR